MGLNRMAFFRIAIEFPALDLFVTAINRYLDMQDGVQQTRINELTAMLAASTAKLESAVGVSTPRRP
jgi:hypothetical protein